MLSPLLLCSSPTPLPSLSPGWMTQPLVFCQNPTHSSQSSSNCAHCELSFLMAMVSSSFDVLSHSLGNPTAISQSLHLYCIANCLFSFLMFLRFLSYCTFPEVKEYYPMPSWGLVVEGCFKTSMSCLHSRSVFSSASKRKLLFSRRGGGMNMDFSPASRSALKAQG